MITLVVPDTVAVRVAELVKLEVETGGILLVRDVRGADDSRRFLVRELIEVPEEAYSRRESDLLLIRSNGYVPVLARAEADGCIALWFHTHPGNGSSPKPSTYDRRVDEQLREVFRIRSGSDVYGAIIFSHHDGHLAFDGHVEDYDSVSAIDRVMIVGDRIRLTLNFKMQAESIDGAFDRNVRALGDVTQRALGIMRVTVVGCGGTGSAVAEQLIRLGVRQFYLIDPDTLSNSNITRVYGSTSADVGRPKVEVLRDHLQRIASDAEISINQSMLTTEATARAVADSDIVFGCTDDNAGRMVLSRLATYLLIPVIDCGVIVSSDDAGRIDGINGRVTVLSPGNACLVCRGRIDLARAASEVLTPDERRRRVDEGYAPALGLTEPAVVTFTTSVAAAAVSELLERMNGYGPTPVPSEILLRLHDREISTNIIEPRLRHYCNPKSLKLGAGITTPFLEQTWQA